MRNGLIGYFCIILYDQWMILQTVNFFDLLCVVFGFRVRTSQKCFFLFFVCSLFFFHYFVLEKDTHFSGFSWENQPQTQPISGWVCLSLGGEC